MHGAGPALGDAAAKLGACQAEGLADRPQERGVRIDVERAVLTVDGQRSCHGPKCKLIFCLLLKDLTHDS